ncbi:MAG: hypothetical protein SFT90_07885 [Rickettsiales bacterium]|nr:hypothetical protein [Rickettsiales bacterium]
MKELTGKKVFLIFTIFFVIIFAVNFYMLYLAIDIQNKIKEVSEKQEKIDGQ